MNKKFIVIILTGVLFLFILNRQNSRSRKIQNLPLSGLVAYYKLNNRTNQLSDLSDRKNDLIPSTKYAENSTNNFSCSSKYCPSFNIRKQLTIGAWIKINPNHFYNNEEIISKWSQDESAFKNSKNYSFFDSSILNRKSKGFDSAIFGGRFLYFIPIKNGENYSGQISRYDITQPFSDSSAWTFIDTEALNANSKGFGGGVFDGRFIYLVPHYGETNRSGQVTRYDTTKDFSSSGSWNFFDTQKLNSHSKGFWGGVFDGKYIYLVPHNDGTDYFGQVTRFDTRGEFQAPSSWSFFDTQNLNPKSKGFVGAVFDGRFVYFVPDRISYETFTGQVTRYDSKKSFFERSSWSFFDTQNLNPKSKGFAGAVFDGIYIYFVPLFSNSIEFNGQVSRFDTTSDFTATSSWSFFDTQNLNPKSKGFVGAVFDGRFVYFVPFRNTYEESHEMIGQSSSCSVNQTGGFNGQITRLDTSKNFTDNTSWSFYDTEILDAKSKGYWGGAFDGRYIYYIPAKFACAIMTGQIIKFDTSGNSHGSYRLSYNQNTQGNSFFWTSVGPRFEINTDKGNFTITSGRLLIPDTWHQITGTFDGSQLNLYIDGELESVNKNIPSHTSILSTTDPFTLKFYSENATNTDDIFIYTRDPLTVNLLNRFIQEQKRLLK